MTPLQRIMAPTLSLCLAACTTVPGAMTHNTQRVAANPPEFNAHATSGAPEAAAAAERERQSLLATIDGLRREVNELRQLARVCAQRQSRRQLRCGRWLPVNPTPHSPPLRQRP
jgi:hypothetical protein